ncbi:MAG: hypothetical protein R6U63_04770, partial [Longimicrobiales bacterium]
PAYRPITPETIGGTRYWSRLDREARDAIRVMAPVLPFRTNRYVLNRLVDWSRIPDDPIFRLTFPHRDMLDPEVYARLRDAHDNGGPTGARRVARSIHARWNPHPQGQTTHNVPSLDGRRLAGIQHKYRETVLFFPAGGQKCFGYCAYCFRWPQFGGTPGMRFSAPDARDLVAYLRRSPEVTDVLVTGGDPLTLPAARLRRFIEPILDPGLGHVQNIRIGTKSPASWPHRFLTDDDADDLLRLFEDVVAAGRHLAVMAHYVHPVELEPPEARAALARIRATGAEVRTQAPIVRHVNDRPAVWADLWREMVRLGAVPYYMFIPRDTGPSSYFEIPLVRAHDIFRDAYARVSGLARSVRGPVMSATPGKVRVLGVRDEGGRRAFILDFLQARDPDLVRRPFLARYNPDAVWFDELRPLEGERFPHI